MHLKRRGGRLPRGRRLARGLGTGVLALAAVGVVLAYTPAGALSASVPVAQYGLDDPNLPWLKTAAGHVVDDRGRNVVLRGFNVDALVSYPGHPPAPFDEVDARLMQRAGFNVVRLGIDWAQLEPVRGQIDSSYLDRVAEAVRIVNAHGAYVVLNMHFRLGWSPRLGGSGAPPWATMPLVPNWNPMPHLSWSPSLSPAVIAANTYFWLSPDWRANFYHVWQAVAQRFRDNPGVAGYDLYNEPHPLPIPPRLFEKYWMWPLYQRAIEAVGSVDPNHLFFVEGILIFNLDTAMVPLRAPNLVYAAHVYDGSLVPPFWNGDPRPLVARFRERQQEARVLNAPLWVGEFGNDLTEPARLPWMDTALDAADDLGVGWAWWQWRENRYWGIRDAAGGHVNLAALSHLARPFLVAAPAGVRAGRGDGLRGRLDITVDAGHAEAPILVAWSSLTLGPPGVAADCVRESRWDASAARLTVDLKPGVSCVLRVEASASPSG